MHASTLPSARSDIGEVDLDLQDRHEDFAEEWQVAKGNLKQDEALSGLGELLANSRNN